MTKTKRFLLFSLQVLLSVQVLAQANNSCKAFYQFYAFDPLIPGATCMHEGSFLDICSVATNKCTAICWECLGLGGAGGHPINLANGNTFISQTDVSVPGLGGGLSLTRTWNSEWPFGESAYIGMFGGKWQSTYEERIFVDGDGFAKYARGTGGIWTLGLVSVSWPLQYTMVAPVSGNLTLSYDGNYWTLAFKSGEKRIFKGSTGQLVSISDRNGNVTQLTYDSSNRLTTVTDPASRHLYFSYAGSSFLATGVSSDIGLSLTYTYDGQNRLSSVTRPDSTTVSFQYDANSLISAVLDTNGKVLEAHTYDGAGRGLSSSRASGVDAVTVSYPVFGLP